ncbi:MAG: PepSY domain-containing protein [Burkholderiales bacterium]|nr:PepSY domain-containing protein [Burkholderiales bacterium]
MRADVIRTYKAVHTWTGIISALALFVCFYAGALTMFMEPLTHWASPPARQAERTGLDAMPGLIDLALQAHPDAAKSFRLEFEAGDATSARLVWDTRSATGTPIQWNAWLAPEGGLRVRQSRPRDLAEFINHVHQTAGLPLPGNAGVTLMGAVGVLYAMALVSGVIILLPTLVKDLFVLRAGRNLKRMWLDMHNVVGLFSLPFHLIMALTVVMLGVITVPAFNSLFSTAVYDVDQRAAFKQMNRRFSPAPATQDGSVPILSPVELLEAVERYAPTFQVNRMLYVDVGSRSARVRVTGLVRETLSWGAAATFDATTGKLVDGNMLPGAQDTWWAVLGSFVGLHFGYYGGEAVRWGYFVLGLAGAWLFYSGNLVWIETRRKMRRRGGELPEQRRDTKWLAAGTVGVCLGCVAGISLTIVAAKWLHGHVADLNAWHRYVYYAVFLGAVAWAFARGAAHASVELLRLSAALTLAIPLTTLAAWLFPSLGLWAHTSSAALGVDITAFAGAVGFTLMAHATALRVRHGPADSVWSMREPAAGEKFPTPDGQTNRI